MAESRNGSVSLRFALYSAMPTIIHRTLAKLLILQVFQKIHPVLGCYFECMLMTPTLVNCSRFYNTENLMMFTYGRRDSDTCSVCRYAESLLLMNSVSKMYIFLSSPTGINQRVSYFLVDSSSIISSTFSRTKDGLFELDATTGLLKVTRTLDREKKSTYNLTIEARDHGSPAMSSRASVVVRVAGGLWQW